MKTPIEKADATKAAILAVTDESVIAREMGDKVQLDMRRIARLIKAWGTESNALGTVIVSRGRLWFAVARSEEGEFHVSAHYGARPEPILRVIPLMIADLDADEAAAPEPEKWEGPAPVPPTANPDK